VVLIRLRRVGSSRIGMGSEPRRSEVARGGRPGTSAGCGLAVLETLGTRWALRAAATGARSCELSLPWWAAPSHLSEQTPLRLLLVGGAVFEPEVKPLRLEIRRSCPPRLGPARPGSARGQPDPAK